MYDYHLNSIVEIIFSLIALVLGLIIVIKARENRFKLFWGILVIITSFSLMEGNIRFFIQPKESAFGMILRLDVMTKWSVLSYIFSFIPLIALNSRRIYIKIISASTPFIFCAGIFCAFLWSGTSFQKLYSLSDFKLHIAEADVQARVLFFLISIIVPLFCSVISFIEIRRHHQRPPTQLLTYYLGCTLISFAVYANWTWNPSPISGTLCVLGCITLPIIFSIFFLFSENPFSFPPTSQKKYITQNESDIFNKSTDGILRIDEKINLGLKDAHKLMEYFVEIDNCIQREKLFCNPAFDKEQVMERFNISRSNLILVIQSGGFMSVREYIAVTRVQYFKQIASENPYRTVGKMAEMSGFPTRMTFYRNFSAAELITPNEFLKQLREGDQSAKSNKTVNIF